VRPLLPSRLAALALALALVAAAGCHRPAPNAEPTADPQAPKPAANALALSQEQRAQLGLVTVKATLGEVPDVELRSGVVLLPPTAQALISTPVSARTRAPVTLVVGMTVREGDPIAEVVPVLSAGEQVTLNVQAADLVGQIASTETQLKNEEAQLARGRALAPRGLISPQDLENQEAAVASTRSKLAALRIESAMQGARGGAVTLRAPIGGLVASVDAPNGATLPAGHVLAQIVIDGPRWIDVAMPTDAPSGSGYSVRVGGAWVRARLLARGVIASPDGLRRDRLELTAAGLVVGATLDVRLERGDAKGVVIPASAIVPTVDGDVVYVDTGDGNFAERPVRVAARLDDRVRLASGVVEGELVVSVGAQGLRGEKMRAALGE
jgi:biotin carboxyl carrier protein